jgi:Rha family phage regulatory protein
MNELVYSNPSGKDVTTSYKVAEKFEREHKNVLRDIENLHCSSEFRLLNFELMFID